MAKPVHINGMTVTGNDHHKMFSLKANGIEISCSCTMEEFKTKHEETMKKVNENFRNSIRYIKYEGTLPKKPDPKVLNKWVSSDTGIAMKMKNIPVPEFVPFSF